MCANLGSTDCTVCKQEFEAPVLVAMAQRQSGSLDEELERQTQQRSGLIKTYLRCGEIRLAVEESEKLAAIMATLCVLDLVLPGWVGEMLLVLQARPLFECRRTRVSKAFEDR